MSKDLDDSKQLEIQSFFQTADSESQHHICKQNCMLKVNHPSQLTTKFLGINFSPINKTLFFHEAFHFWDYPIPWKMTHFGGQFSLYLPFFKHRPLNLVQVEPAPGVQPRVRLHRVHRVRRLDLHHRQRTSHPPEGRESNFSKN